MESITKKRQLIAEQLSTEPFDSNSWLLLGTSGCHLCDIAENTLNSFATVYPINIIKVDIIDLNEDLMRKFSTLIPVILTSKSQINYPFSIVDLSAQHNNITN